MEEEKSFYGWWSRPTIKEDDTKTSSGLDRYTLGFLEDYYARETVKPVSSLIEAATQFEKEPDFKNYLAMRDLFREIEANMTRRDGFRCHNR